MVTLQISCTRRQFSQHTYMHCFKPSKCFTYELCDSFADTVNLSLVTEQHMKQINSLPNSFFPTYMLYFLGNNKMPYKKMPLVVSVQLRVLHQECGIGVSKLHKRFPMYSKTSIYRHMKKPIGDAELDKRHNNKGAPRKLVVRNDRALTRSMKKLMDSVGTFHSTELQEDAGLVATCSNRTVRRHLKRKGYGFYQCRKKGQMSPEDLKERVKFCKKCKTLPTNFWTEGISFYLDGTGWAHKTDPCKSARTKRTRMWRLKGHGLKREYVGKGKKEGTAGKMARFMVAIAHGKGVIYCHQYHGKIDGEKFAEFVRRHFPALFRMGNNVTGKLFLQDGDPSQNSAVAKEAMEEVPCRLFKIPPRSPDLNPIENVFNLVGEKLRKDALQKQITKETYEQFCIRIKQTMYSFPEEVISKTIATMNKRVDMIIASGGNRVKY